MPKEINQEKLRKLVLHQIGINPDLIDKWDLENKVAPVAKEQEVLIEGPIVSAYMGAMVEEFFGPGLVTSKASFKNALQSKTGTVLIRVNSPGGQINEATGLRQAIIEYQETQGNEVNVLIEGMAASAASFCIMSADRIEATEISQVMMHCISGGLRGTAKDFKRYAEHVGKLDMAVAKVYGDRMGKSRDDTLKLMEEETWYDAAGGVEAGIIDAVCEPKEGENLQASAIEEAQQEELGKLLGLPVV